MSWCSRSTFRHALANNSIAKNPNAKATTLAATPKPASLAEKTDASDWPNSASLPTESSPSHQITLNPGAGVDCFQYEWIIRGADEY